MKSLPALFLLLLTACAADPALTPAQALHLLREDYTIVLERAADYREQCDAKPVLLQARCQGVVEDLRSIHREALPLFKEADMAVQTGNNQRIDTAVAALARIKSRLEQRLVESIQNPSKPAPVETTP